MALASNQAYAKPEFVTYQPADYNGVISCTSCHTSSAATEDNVGLSYGVLFDQTGADDDVIASIAPAYRSIEQTDSDGDGFSNIQEIKAPLFPSNFNSRFSTPLLSGAGLVNFGSPFTVVSALPALNETVSSLSSVPTTPTSVTAKLKPGEKNIGGTVDYTMTNLGTLANPVVSAGTTTFMFKTGGAQVDAYAYFIDSYGSATVIPSVADSYGNVATIPMITPTAVGSIATSVGSITVTIADGGPFDLYTEAGYDAEAIARTPNFTPTDIFDAYANVDIYAQISPLAIIDPYAIIDAYAIVDDYAYVGPGVEVYSYAYIAPNVDVYANVDPYVAATANVTVGNPAVRPTPTQFSSAVQSRIAIATTQPTVLIYSGGGGGSEGGLHCMTSGLGVQGLMFFALLAIGLLVRRKKLR